MANQPSVEGDYPGAMPAFITSHHHYAFRADEWAEIIGVGYLAMADDLYPRLCYLIEYADGKRDARPMYDEHAHYEFTWKDQR